MATVAEVEVNRQTGTVHVKRFVCVHDCGLIVNPEALPGTVSANLIQSLSRSLKEEVTFDGSHVTSVDWNSLPHREGVGRARSSGHHLDQPSGDSAERRRRTIEPAHGCGHRLTQSSMQRVHACDKDLLHRQESKPRSPRFTPPDR